LPQEGYKVANVRIVKDVELPKSLFEVDPEKDTINAIVLTTIRKARQRV
jgi:regulator of PEP synthase PpsR (kinase-PPPase family)